MTGLYIYEVTATFLCPRNSLPIPDSDIVHSKYSSMYVAVTGRTYGDHFLLVMRAVDMPLRNVVHIEQRRVATRISAFAASLSDEITDNLTWNFGARYFYPQAANLWI
jgi:hypothetical protein